MNPVSNMNSRNFKLFFEYIFFNLHHLYLTHKLHGYKNISLLIPQTLLYYSSIHMRFSSVLYSSQLVDIFSYELPLSNSDREFTTNKNSFFSQNSIVVYNFHNLTFQERFFLYKKLKVFQFSLKKIMYCNKYGNVTEKEIIA